MLIHIIFTLSAVLCIMWAVVVIGFIFGEGITLPLPFLHHLNIDATTTFIGFPALCYQVYFWATYCGVLV